MFKRYSLGIDTSNYKTSIAITDEQGKIIYQKSSYLPVEKGERGLRQSVAHFMQTSAIAEFIEEAFAVVDPEAIKLVAVSSQPRKYDNSYMPCFLAGLNAAKAVAASLKVPYYTFSHQEGHVEAVLSSADRPIPGRCIMYHLSGGTTEILKCEKNLTGYYLPIIGGTLDISIGQLLDRVGVKMGLDFPAGGELDKIALELGSSVKPSKIKNFEGQFNLSGIETEMLRKVDEKANSRIQVPGLFDRIAELLYETAVDLSSMHSISKVYMAGGVAASQYIRDRLTKITFNYDKKPCEDFEIIFGDPILSGDNAVGIARLGTRIYNTWNSQG